MSVKYCRTRSSVSASSVRRERARGGASSASSAKPQSIFPSPVSSGIEARPRARRSAARWRFGPRTSETATSSKRAADSVRFSFVIIRLPSCRVPLFISRSGANRAQLPYARGHRFVPASESGSTPRVWRLLRGRKQLAKFAGSPDRARLRVARATANHRPGARLAARSFGNSKEPVPRPRSRAGGTRYAFGGTGFGRARIRRADGPLRRARPLPDTARASGRWDRRCSAAFEFVQLRSSPTADRYSHCSCESRSSIFWPPIPCAAPRPLSRRRARPPARGPGRGSRRPRGGRASRPRTRA